MRIMALDIATTTGVAIGDAGSKPETFSIVLKRRTNGPEVAAFNIRAFLQDQFAERRPDLVAIEHYMLPQYSQNADATVLLLMCHGVAMAECLAAKIRVEVPQVNSVRKHFCGWASAGDRKSTKLMVLRRAKLLGYLDQYCTDDNQADACALWDYACAKFASESGKKFEMFGA